MSLERCPALDAPEQGTRNCIISTGPAAQPQPLQGGQKARHQSNPWCRAFLLWCGSLWPFHGRFDRAGATNVELIRALTLRPRFGGRPLWRAGATRCALRMRPQEKRQQAHYRDQHGEINKGILARAGSNQSVVFIYFHFAMLDNGQLRLT